MGTRRHRDCNDVWNEVRYDMGEKKRKKKEWGGWGAVCKAYLLCIAQTGRAIL